ncbi:unnamed protein product [marine sediment metagenome]|uniref:Uncharacterized protein n=1 Tax=marine sediment metagenome TaxID=412755 RepID=X1U978_9ZZZZ
MIMKPTLEHLRNLSQTHRDRVKKATDIAEKMKLSADAAAKLSKEIKGEKG